MEFRVLGPLEAIGDDGRPVRLGGQRERALLALLLTRPNQVVSVDAIVDGLWGEQPPRSAAKTLQSHVVRLRRTLEPARPRGTPGEVLVTREPGYLLRVAPGALDAARFEELCATARRALARGEAEVAASTLRAALGLWRGPAFQEFQHTSFARAEAERLAELRLVAIDDRIEADLRLGGHRELVPELEGLVSQQPLRERLWAALLLALYRSGRQADALRVYQRARTILVEELGIEPGAELRRLQAAILAQDPALDLVPATPQLQSVGELPGALALVDPPCLGRAKELAFLQDAWKQLTRERGGAVFVAGPAGIGKTRLAAELAHQVHAQGALVGYGGCAPPPAPPLQPLAQVLSGLGASLADLGGMVGDGSAAELGVALAGLLQDTAAGRPLLVVVDELHLADPAVLEVLQHLHGAGAAGPLVMLGLYRDDLANLALGALLESVDPAGAWRLHLGPLDAEAVAGIAASYAGQPPPAKVVSALHRDSGGVPLLVHRAARAWATARAGQRLDAAASRGAADRGQLRAAETEIAQGVVDLQRLRQPLEQASGRAVVCPYKGLARFEPSDAEFFFGRERLVAELVARLVGAGLLAVVGPSGSGKSSLIRAGLLPALREGVLPGSQRWRQVLVRPGEHPMREVARLLDIGDDGPGMLLRVAERYARADGRLLLVVDQFEEVFTACQDPQERTSFLDELLDAAGAEQGAVVVVGLRADYYGRCAEHPGLAAQLGASQVLVGPMRPGELRQAVELPAERAGLRVDPELTQAMVADVADEPGGLPLLSTALLEGWERRQGRTLTLAGYHQAGGVHGAVARLAERAWRGLDPEQQQAARRLLLRLAGPGEGAAVVRRRVPLSEFTASRDERVRLVLDALADHRLLTKDEDTVEVAHEALLREWPRLRGWLEEDVQGRALHRHLIGAAREWEVAERDPGELYRGARLTGALDWARDHDADVNELEREFLDASRAAAEREMADARRRADREARTSRRLRGVLAGLAVVLVLALVAGGLALAQRDRADRAALAADARRVGAQALLQGDLDRSLLLAAEAVRLDDSVDTRSALLSSLLRSPQAIRVMRGGGNRLQSIALSANGRMLAATDNMGLVYLWDAKTGRRVAGPLEAPSVGTLYVPVFSPDGRVLAAGGAREYGGIVLWDVADHKVIRRLKLAASETDIVEAAFSPDGRVLAASTQTGSLAFWNPASGVRLGPVLHPYRIPEVGQPGVSLAFGHGGATLYTSAQDRTIVWDVARRHPVRRFPVGGRIAVSPDGKTLAVGRQDGTVTLADAVTGRRRLDLTGPTGPVFRLAFSRDGTTLASVSDDRTAIVWDVATGRALEKLVGHAGMVHGVAFSPDGRTLYTSSLDDSVIAWDLTGTRGLARRLTRQAGHVTGVAFSPRDANLLGLVRDDGPATLWNVARRARVGTTLPVTGGWLNSIAFSPDGKTLAAPNHADGTVVLFDVATHRRVGHPLRPPYGRLDSPYTSKDINNMVFSSDGKLLATAGNDGSTVLWDVARQVPIGRPLRPRPGFAVNAVALSPDGRTLASGMDDGTVVLTRMPDRTVLHKLTVTDGPGISALGFSPDGKILATGAINGKVRLWDPGTGTARGRAWVAQAGFVASTAFSPDGKVLATSGGEGTATLWDAGSGKQIGAPLPGLSQKWAMAAFAPTGHTLGTAFQDGTVLLWDVDPASWRKRACAVAGRDLTREEWEDFLPGRPYQPPCGIS